jgi:ribosomal protein S12 methylthiotransferase accessory factor
LERQSYIFQGDEAVITAPFVDLKGDAIHPDDLQNFSAAQSASSFAGEKADPRRFVPPPFDEHAEIKWTPAWSMTNECRRWLPLTYCYSQIPILPERHWCPFNPNGHAAGNCIEEAILQAFLELVERDAVAIWWYNRVSRPEVNLESFDVQYFIALRNHYRSLGWRMWVLDLTHDLRIPCFAALARAEQNGRFAVGFGCHLDASLGVQRAVTELNQLFDPSGTRSPWAERDFPDARYLFPSSARPCTRDDFAPPEQCDIRDDVVACVGRARQAGLETLVIDQTRPDVRLSVVKVVVPGLRHIWPRFGPGRLYEVPTAIGWVDKPHEERELNPIPLLL